MMNQGVGISTFEPKQKSYPLASGADAAKSSDTKDDSIHCVENAMDPKKVKGKLVYCKLSSWGADSVVKGLGGAGVVLEGDIFLDAAQIFMTPATLVNSTTGKKISDYIQSTKYIKL